MVNARSFLVPFKYSHKVAYMLEFSPHKIRFYKQGALLRPVSEVDNVEVIEREEIVSMSAEENNTDLTPMVITDDVVIEGEIVSGLNNQPYEISSPYGFDDLWDEEELCFQLQTIQHSDVLYIFSEHHPIMVLKRYGDLNWVLEELALKNGPFLAMNSGDTLLTPSDVSGTITLTADHDIFHDSDVGRLVRLRAFSGNEKIWAAGLTATVGMKVVSDNKYYEAENGGTTGTKKPVHDDGIRSDGGVRWQYLHDGIGVVKITAYVDPREVTATVITRLPDAAVDGTVYWELGMISGSGLYPKSGAFFRNRFAFLLNTDEGPKVCLSVSGDYNNFADHEHGETTAESAITVPVLNTEFNEGKWLFAGDVLFVGCGAAEFMIDVISASAPLANDNVKIVQISNVGSKAIVPVRVGAHIFFADRYGLSLRDLSYNYYNDGYDQIDISLLGKHLFVSRIVGLCYQEVPDKILWCLAGSGEAIALTFSAEQQVAALSRHDFSGAVESMAVIPNLNSCHDEVWLEVRREINFETVRTVEYLENGMPLNVPAAIYKETDIKQRELLENEYVLKNSCFLDGAYLFVREVDDDSVEISGLSHLEGEVVSIFADGHICAPQVVIDGKVKIAVTDNVVLVGKEIHSQYVPQAVYLPNETTTGIGEKQRINHVMLMLYRSGGGQIGESEGTLCDILYRNVDEKMNTPQPLFSGCKEILFNGSTSSEGEAAEVLIENKSPLPMNILAIVMSMD